MTENQLATRKPQELKTLIRTDAIKEKFIEALGSRQVGGFISNVMITVAENEKLQLCTPVSIISAALRAATMRLSVDLTSGQAYLVPFKGKATLVVGYKGLVHLALRTGKYRVLNVGEIYEGEEIIEDRLTGLHHLSGQCISRKVIGHLLYMEMMNGFIKTMYMTCQECDEHGRKYSRGYHLDTSLWKLDPEKMHRKTLLRLGITQWGYIEPADQDSLAALEDEDQDHPAFTLPSQVIDPDPDPRPEPGLTDEQAMKQLGFMD